MGASLDCLFGGPPVKRQKKAGMPTASEEIKSGKDKKTSPNQMEQKSQHSPFHGFPFDLIGLGKDFDPDNASEPSFLLDKEKVLPSSTSLTLAIKKALHESTFEEKKKDSISETDVKRGQEQEAFQQLNDRVSKMFHLPPICTQETLKLESSNFLPPATKLVYRLYPDFNVQLLACCIRRILLGNGLLAQQVHHQVPLKLMNLAFCAIVHPACSPQQGTFFYHLVKKILEHGLYERALFSDGDISMMYYKVLQDAAADKSLSQRQVQFSLCILDAIQPKEQEDMETCPHYLDVALSFHHAVRLICVLKEVLKLGMPTQTEDWPEADAPLLRPSRVFGWLLSQLEHAVNNHVQTRTTYGAGLSLIESNQAKTEYEVENICLAYYFRNQPNRAHVLEPAALQSNHLLSRLPANLVPTNKGLFSLDAPLHDMHKSMEQDKHGPMVMELSQSEQEKDEKKKEAETAEAEMIEKKPFDDELTNLNPSSRKRKRRSADQMVMSQMSALQAAVSSSPTKRVKKQDVT